MVEVNPDVGSERDVEVGVPRQRAAVQRGCDRCRRADDDEVCARPSSFSLGKVYYMSREVGLGCVVMYDLCVYISHELVSILYRKAL